MMGTRRTRSRDSSPCKVRSGLPNNLLTVARSFALIEESSSSTVPMSNYPSSLTATQLGTSIFDGVRLGSGSDNESHSSAMQQSGRTLEQLAMQAQMAGLSLSYADNARLHEAYRLRNNND